MPEYPLELAANEDLSDALPWLDATSCDVGQIVDETFTDSFFTEHPSRFYAQPEDSAFSLDHFPAAGQGFDDVSSTSNIKSADGCLLKPTSENSPQEPVVIDMLKEQETLAVPDAIALHL
ncbi:hypothetical protein AYL99_08697 [Fonsecaea erecta]|uniref:Uncharacterized protein n=1 Tax=Fonsecaea erecta TaxID=1367422 RepID=A0A178ZBX6_9EURO|nr:hypothetical protein AYL99_08697 [Fonsecaea erecta]OAP56585.1 hypothetical protein AYL99_08697 [Fonsecaea erecta]